MRTKFVKNTSMLSPVKSLGYIKCYSSSSLRPVKSLGVLSDATVRRSIVDLEDVKPSGNQKIGHISLGNQQFYYLKFFETLYKPQKED